MLAHAPTTLLNRARPPALRAESAVSCPRVVPRPRDTAEPQGAGGHEDLRTPSLQWMLPPDTKGKRKGTPREELAEVRGQGARGPAPRPLTQTRWAHAGSQVEQLRPRAHVPKALVRRVCQAGPGQVSSRNTKSSRVPHRRREQSSTQRQQMEPLFRPKAVTHLNTSPSFQKSNS